MRSRVRALPVLLASALAWLAAGCGGASPTGERPAAAVVPPSVRSVEEPEPRLAVTYDGGVLVLRATDGEVLADEEVPGFLRVGPAGDERHVVLSHDGGFTALDLGAWTADHGDHGHSYTDHPELTSFTVPAEEPGHVVVHDGHTTLFDDGTGRATAFGTHELGDLDDTAPELETTVTDDPHHGVAARLHDVGWLRTVGTSESRSGVEVVTDGGEVVVATDECPGVHGETFAGHVAALGCEDGLVLVDGDRIRKVQAPDAYGRIGNQAGSPVSPYVLGDYKTDPDAELERPERVSVVDTRDASLTLVHLGTSYSFRSLGRTPDGDGLVLGTDGALHLVDLRRAAVSDSLPVVDRWREPLDWTRPRPTLAVVGEHAYVTEPASSEIHVVDLERLRVVTSYVLPQVPNEVVGVTG